MNHLSVGEIEKITDTSDMSWEYMEWYEKADEHIASCPLCREQVRRKLLCDDLSHDKILQYGIGILDKEELIQKNIVIAKLMQQSGNYQSIVNAMIARQYVQTTLYANSFNRMKKAVYRGEIEQQDLNYKMEDEHIKIQFSDKVYQGINLEGANVIMLNDNTDIKVEKICKDEEGKYMARFEWVNQVENSIFYVVAHKESK